MRPSLDYGVAVCVGCHRSASSGLQLEATGQIKRALPVFMRGRKFRKETGDMGPRFNATHEREWATLRCECGHQWDVSGSLALEDARKVADGRVD